jgi:hypothetical protein
MGGCTLTRKIEGYRIFEMEPTNYITDFPVSLSLFGMFVMGSGHFFFLKIKYEIVK